MKSLNVGHSEPQWHASLLFFLAKSMELRGREGNAAWIKKPPSPIPHPLFPSFPLSLSSSWSLALQNP